MSRQTRCQPAHPGVPMTSTEVMHDHIPRSDGTVTPKPTRERAKALWSMSWPPALIAILLVIAWQAYVWVSGIEPFLLPGPFSVLEKAFDFSSINWVEHIGITTAEIVIGFVVAAVAGVGLGTAIAWSTWAQRALVPLLVLLNTLPKVALAPMFLFWLGYGVFPNAVIAAMIAFFPIVVNTSVGLVQVDEDLLDLGRSLRSPKWREFTSLRFPTALPYIMSSLKVGVTMAVVGAIVGEFVAGQSGLGYVITAVQSSLQTDVALAAMFWISIIGLVLYGLVDLIGRWVVPWSDPKNR